MTNEEKIDESEDKPDSSGNHVSKKRSKIDHVEMAKSTPDDESVPDEPAKPKRRMTVIGRIKPDNTFEFPAKESRNPDVKPWDIDTSGQLISEKRKNKPKTPYHFWLENQRKNEGTEVICPACGTVNYELLHVSGEKCTNCGFEYDSCEDLAKKLESRTAQAMRHPAEREKKLSQDALKKILALPDEILSDPDKPFVQTYRTYSHVLQLFLIPCFIVGISIIYLHMKSDSNMQNPIEAPELIFWYYGSMIVFLFFALNALLNFIRTSRITAIEVDNHGATFHSTFSKQRLIYEQIISIGNERHTNGWGAFISLLSADANSPLIPGLFSRRRTPGMQETDIASSSRAITNNVTISTPYQSVFVSFTGGENGQFVQALAIIIYLAGRKNPTIWIEPSALLAAEKGYNDYSDWLRRKS